VSTKIAVLGSGAQGAGIGSNLIQAGHDVTFIEQWPAHVEAMRKNGIRVVMPTETTTTPVRAIHLCEVAELREQFDVVFVLVKAYDTRWACELIKPYVKDDGFVVGLQNGMSIDDMAAVVGAHRTLGSVIEMASNMYEPGIVTRETPPAGSWFALGAMDAAQRERVPAVAALLEAAGTVELFDDIRSAKWMKLVANAAELVPSAILNLPLADAIRVPGMQDYMLEAGKEAVRTAIALGNRLVPIFGMTEEDLTEPDQYAIDLLDQVLEKFSSPTTRTTVLQDWIKGRRSEVDQVNGLVVDEQARLGGTAPANALAVELAHRIESGDLRADPSNIDLLLASRVA
jgi:2-dehydropantoate 2-reductase